MTKNTNPESANTPPAEGTADKNSPSDTAQLELDALRAMLGIRSNRQPAQPPRPTQDEDTDQ